MRLGGRRVVGRQLSQWDSCRGRMAAKQHASHERRLTPGDARGEREGRSLQVGASFSMHLRVRRVLGQQLSRWHGADKQHPCLQESRKGAKTESAIGSPWGGEREGGGGIRRFRHWGFTKCRVLGRVTVRGSAWGAGCARGR